LFVELDCELLCVCQRGGLGGLVVVFVVEVDASPEVFGGIGLVDDEFGGISTDGVDGLFDGGESVSRRRGVCGGSFGSHTDRDEFGVWW
jgi:hypothetical protein